LVSGSAAEKVIGEGISMKSWIGDYRIESALILPSLPRRQIAIALRAPLASPAGRVGLF
jgi:hypothetical protein